MVVFLIVRSLIISEILYDPDPAVGLPPFEYVEWYNSGADTVDLAGWQWVVGDKARRIAGGRVSPGGYLIVCAPAAAPAFRHYGATAGLESFPALRNTGDRLTLVNPEGVAVHTVEYSPNQFNDALKSSGGWSLELTSPADYCNPAAWAASADPSGGTPGRANSQLVRPPEAGPPMLVRAADDDGQRFVLLFSGTLDPGISMYNYACRLSPGDWDATPVAPPGYGVNGLYFTRPAGINPDQVYTITLEGTVAGCSGSEALLRPVLFGTPAEPDSAGILITEILFDPADGQTEFVEVFNRSGRVAETAALILARADAGGKILGFSDAQELPFWLFPGCHAVLTADAAKFARAWPDADPGIIVSRPDMPSLTNSESQLILMDRNQKVLDVAAYSPEWHYPYLEATQGVSLERISLAAPGTDRANWFSASAAAGYSTPGQENSCRLSTPSILPQGLTLDLSTGFSESPSDPVRMNAAYRFEEPGWFLRMMVYNAEGQPVREIFPFALAGKEGSVGWDGLDGLQRLVPEGICLVVADFYHPSGKKGRWKRAWPLIRNY
jgi:hypothetical protein